MTKALLLGIALMAAIPCIWGFAQWERQGKALRAVVILLALELVEAALYPNESLIPRGIFHPGSGTTQLRLPELFITLALLGRLVAKRRPERIGYPSLLWAAFGVWLLVEVAEGYLRGNDHSQVLYEGKAIIYIVGGYALAAGIPVRRYLDAQVFERLTRWFAPPILLIDLMAAAHQAININLPLLPVDGFGGVGSDAATMFGALGVVTLVLELGQERHNLWTMACTVPLLLTAVLAGQRAALIGLGATVAFLVLMALGPVARRRLRVRPTEMLIALGAVGAVTIVVILGPAALSLRPANIPLSSTINTAFSSEQKLESAQDRVNEFNAARQMIPQHQILGWGLGVEYTYWAPGPNTEITSALTEDIYTDLWLRTGLIGLALFVAATLVSLADGHRIWRLHHDRMVAVFAVALVAAVLGLLVKGGFESDLNNYRLATTLGLLLGMLRCAVTSAGGTLSTMPGRLVTLHDMEKA